ELAPVDTVEATALASIDIGIHPVQIAREDVRPVSGDLGQRGHHARSRGRATRSRKESRSFRLLRLCSRARSCVSARRASGSTPCSSSSCLYTRPHSPLLSLLPS